MVAIKVRMETCFLINIFTFPCFMGKFGGFVFKMSYDIGMKVAKIRLTFDG